MQPPTDLVRIDQNPPPTGYSFCDPTAGQWGCGYTDGLRVPLLVVSPYTRAGYVSGACGSGEPNQCPYFGPQGNQYEYVHDFGSILRYTELNFGMPLIWSPDYADANAPDGANGNTPLLDFFPLQVGQGLPFTYIAPAQGATDQCFQQHQGTNCPLATSWAPGPPDSD